MGGEDNQVGTVNCVSLMTQHHTNYVVSLMKNNVNVQQRPNRVWYTQAHDLADRAVGFVSKNHGEGGRIKGGRKTRPGLESKPSSH